MRATGLMRLSLQAMKIRTMCSKMTVKQTSNRLSSCFRPSSGTSSCSILRIPRLTPSSLSSRQVMLQIRQASVSAAATAEAEPQTEEHQYQAEVDRLMDMIVNSLYSNREVFLRELISNSSDALDKIRFLSLTDKDVMGSGEELEIRIKADPEANTITIEDSGIGMTKEDLLSSLGTIARSGTAKFAEAMKEAKNDANLIGQFGVGFYSSFLVAERVAVQTKHKDDQQWRWESAAGAHSYKIMADKSGDLSRGTRVTLYLKEDAKELTDDKKLASLIKQYSEFIQFPIRLWQSATKTEQVLDEEATAKKREEAVEAAKSSGEDPEKVEVQEVKKSKSTTEWDWAVQNDNKPIWTRSPRDVSEEEYSSFFKSTFKEFLDPAAHSHFNVEGTIEFSALLFVPGMAPFEETNWMAKSRNIRLFVKRVFISDEFDDNLLPRYLTFVKGVVDSSDLPLNVSREILQESRVVRTIKKQLVRRSLEMLHELAKREPKEAPEGSPAGTPPSSDYDIFWESFGKFLKLGVLDDEANRKTLGGLLRFESSKSDAKMSSLADVVGRMKPSQKDIYFIAAENKASASSSPFVERLTKKDLEVLYLTEPIDEPTITALGEFEGKKFVDVSREGLDLGDEEEDKKKVEAATEALQGLTDFMKGALGDRVEKVTVSQRLADSPCALVTSKFGWSAAQERLMKAQALGDARAAEYMKGRKVLELNPDHPIIQSLNNNFGSDAESSQAITELLYETSLVTSGFTVDSPKEFADRIYSMIGLASATGQSDGSEGTGNEAVEPEVMDDVSGSDPWKQ